MKGLFIPEITSEMFRNGCLESIETLMAEGEIYDIDYSPWIPVSERLPKSCGVYIVSRWFSDGEESAILTDANYYDGCGEWYNDNRINWGRELVTDKIVAWMPLPEPYKEGE